MGERNDHSMLSMKFYCACISPFFCNRGNSAKRSRIMFEPNASPTATHSPPSIFFRLAAPLHASTVQTDPLAARPLASPDFPEPSPASTTTPLRHPFDSNQTPMTILQILSLTLFEKMPISQALAQLPPAPASTDTENHQCLLDF